MRFPYQPSSQFVYIYANLAFQELTKLDVLRRKLKKLSTRLEVRGGSRAPVEFIVAAKGDDPEDTPYVVEHKR